MPIPSTKDRYIMAARVKGYLDKPHDAIEILTTALDQWPDDPRLLRFRGHRRISIRDFEGAISDLRRASEQLSDTPDEFELYQKDIEPDAFKLIIGVDDDLNEQHPLVSDIGGTPQADKYMSSLHTAVWYHLGVALYCKGDLTQALPVFGNAYDTALHYEGKIASLDWQYMIMRRLGQHELAQEKLVHFAALADEWDEAGVGYDNRMRLYSGELSPEDLRETISDNRTLLATVGYGLGNWYLYNGEQQKAQDVFQDVLDTGAKYAFGYLAVQSEMAGLGELSSTRS